MMASGAAELRRLRRMGVKLTKHKALEREVRCEWLELPGCGCLWVMKVQTGRQAGRLGEALKAGWNLPTNSCNGGTSNRTKLS